MAPTGKQKPETQGSAPAPPLLECALSKDVDITPVLPWTTTKSNEHGRTLIWPDATAKWPASKVMYLLFLHSVLAGLVPPFSSFFTAILNHYGIQALHLQPNSILLLSVFAYYNEAFVGVQLLVALFRHFFNLHLHDDTHLSTCVSFVAAQSGNLLLKAGKKVNNFRHRWVLLSLKDANPRLEEPKRLPEKTHAWSLAKLSNPRAMTILERFSLDISAKRLTSGMIVKEFLAQRLAPLQAHSRPLGDYRAGDDELRLRSEDLPTEELNRVVAILLAGDPGALPSPGVCSGRGVIGRHLRWGDSEKTVDSCPASAPLPSHAILLRDLEDDDAVGEVSAGISWRPTRASRGPASTLRATRSAWMLASEKLRAVSPSAHPASAGGRSEVSGSPPSVGGGGALSLLPLLGQSGRRDGSTSKSKLLALVRLARSSSVLG
ncbi:hypothetical protein D1007_15008 [Hordeum vulgare]|nr:hypothetical protein D1007_15008 [Hordeum vulgare]